MYTVRERDRGDQKCSIVIADRVPPKNKHPPILCTYTALWAISRRCPAQIVCSSNPFSSIPWNSTRIITASLPANYVFVRGRTNALRRRVYTLLLCTFQRRRWAFARERYGYDIVARLLRIRRNLTYIPAPTNQHSTGRIARAVRSCMHLTMGHTNKVVYVWVRNSRSLLPA